MAMPSMSNYNLPEAAGAGLATYALARSRGHMFSMHQGLIAAAVPISGSFYTPNMSMAGMYGTFVYYGLLDAAIVALCGYGSLKSALMSGAACGVGALAGSWISNSMSASASPKA